VFGRLHFSFRKISVQSCHDQLDHDNCACFETRVAVVTSRTVTPYADCISSTVMGENYAVRTNKTCTYPSHYNVSAKSSVMVSYPGCNWVSAQRWNYALMGDV
jgi:hypothetical protein